MPDQRELKFAPKRTICCVKSVQKGRYKIMSRIDSVSKQYFGKPSTFADAAFFLKEAANLDLEFEVKNGGVDMWESLEKRYKEKEQETTVNHLKDIMTKLKYTVDQAMDLLNIPSDQRATYTNLVNAK